VPWPLYQGYLGDWRVFPLLMATWPDGLDRNLAANQARCPRSLAVLRELGAHGAGFSWVGPGCHILPHTDAYVPGLVRTHLCLAEAAGVYMRIGNQWYEWFDGEVLSFDGQTEHEVVHLGQQRRIVLLADMLLR